MDDDFGEFEDAEEGDGGVENVVGQTTREISNSQQGVGG